jgi:transposase
MKEFNPEQHWIEMASALEIVCNAEVNAATLERHAAYVGLDVHKETIAVAVAAPGRSEPVYRGEIANKPKRVQKLLTELGEAYRGALLQFCYEAGPCGYVLYRQIIASGHDCQAVAPSRIPKTPGERIKTDRRDALKLARLLRAGDLTAVWVPDQDQEMMRDLSSFKNGQLGSST